MTVLLIGGLAAIFYHIGDHEYTRKGWLLSLLSVALSVGIRSTGLGVLGILGANLILYFVCLGYNLIANKPPSSGF